MIHNPDLVRRLVVGFIDESLNRMFSRVQGLQPPELDMVSVLDYDKRMDLATVIADGILERAGALRSSPATPRFSKTHRALNAARAKPPRGARAALTKAERKALDGKAQAQRR